MVRKYSSFISRCVYILLHLTYLCYYDISGEIEREEWTETIEYYLELKEEEQVMKTLSQMASREEERRNKRATMRATMLNQLGKGASKRVSKVEGKQFEQ